MSEELKPPYTGPITSETARLRAQQAVEYYRKHVKKQTDLLSPRGYSRPTGTYNGVQSRGRNENDGRGSAVNIPSSSDGDGYNHFNRGGHRATIHAVSSARPRPPERTRHHVHGNITEQNEIQSDSHSSSSRRTSRGLCRSNSNLEMDSMEYLDVDVLNTSNISSKREYGSTSSLDMMSTSSDSFFAMLQNLGTGNFDQRSPAPAKIKEYLRGKVEMDRRLHSKDGELIPNGSALRDSVDDIDGTQSPKTKTKFKQKDRKARSKSITPETGPGLLKKARGRTDYESGALTPDNLSDIELSSDERFRRKAFVHYDCQSIGFELSKVLRNQKLSTATINISTGASAASANRNSYAGDSEDPDIIANTDDGDNKNNDLVHSCPFFRNELGGEEERTVGLTRTTSQTKRSLQKSSSNSHLRSAISFIRPPVCCGVSILDTSPTPTGHILPPYVEHKGHIVEYADHGAYYYRHFFNGSDHQNYFGIDESIGPVAISWKREKLDERGNNLGKSEAGQYQHRIVLRTSDLTTLRGAILEDAVPSSGSKLGSKGTPLKDVLEFLVPDLSTSCLRQAVSGPKSCEQLMKLDEQRIFSTYKIGIMYCRSGQCTEEDMYNNETSGPAFEEFLNCIGQKVRLKGFEKYRAQLDNKTDSTGTHSVYTSFNNCEIMFHVSTMLPFTPNNKQQLLRKRHIGNDIVTIVFQEPGALPFTAKSVRSQFQHVFIVVRAHNPCTENTSYSIAVSRSKDVPPFGPPIPANTVFKKSQKFADLLLAKVINGENAAHHSEKFQAMATRTRQEYLKDLASNFSSNNLIDSASKLSKFGLSGKKKDKNKQKMVPDWFALGAVVWRVQVEDVGLASPVACLLGIAAETVAIVEESTKEVIFTTHCGAVIGWTPQAISLKLYYNQGECLVLKPLSSEMEELQEIVTRLKAVTPGCETMEYSLKRNGLGQLGFHIQAEGIVTDVEHMGFAYEAGLRKGSRLVEICKVATTTLTHDQMVDLLRTSATVKVVVIPPLLDGGPRGVVNLHANHHYSSFAALNAVIQAEYSHHQRKVRSSSSSSEQSIASPSSEQPKVEPRDRASMVSTQGTSNTLPIQRKSSSSSLSNHRGEVKSPPGRQYYTTEGSSWQSSLPRGTSQSYHGYTDSLASSGRGSLDGRDGGEAFVSKRTLDDSTYGTLEERHTRTGSKDSGEYIYAASGAVSSSREWSSQSYPSSRNQQQQKSEPPPLVPRHWPLESAPSNRDSGPHQTYLTSSETIYSSTQQVISRKASAPVITDYASVQHGNFQQELLKQSQNTKYLLSQHHPVQDTTGRQGNSANSSSNLSDTSFSSGSSHATSIPVSTAHGGQGQGDSAVDKDDGVRKRANTASAVTNKARSQNEARRHLNVSPLSSDSSPRSSHRNLSGMSSEESLTTRLRPGVSATTKLTKSKGSNDLTEELMRLIDPDDLHGRGRDPDRRRSGRLQRTMSDESLHSQKGILQSDFDVRDVHFSTADRNREQVNREKRLSPRAIIDTPIGWGKSVRSSADKAKDVPLPDSTASLEWSSLVDVATKAIEGSEGGTCNTKERPSSLTGQKDSRSDIQYRHATTTPPQDRMAESAPTGGSVWKSVVSNPQQRIQQLEAKVHFLQQELDKERQENAALESEVQQLRNENVRLQEESQTAAAQLRRFTEWFFNTIDRQ